MGKLKRLHIWYMKLIGFVPVEHILYGEYYAPSEDGLFMTLKRIVVTEIEFFQKGTPKTYIDRMNIAFARQKISISNLYSYRTQYSWRIIE